MEKFIISKKEGDKTVYHLAVGMGQTEDIDKAYHWSEEEIDAWGFKYCDNLTITKVSDL